MKCISHPSRQSFETHNSVLSAFSSNRIVRSLLIFSSVIHWYFLGGLSWKESFEGHCQISAERNFFRRRWTQSIWHRFANSKLFSQLPSISNHIGEKNSYQSWSHRFWARNPAEASEPARSNRRRTSDYDFGFSSFLFSASGRFFAFTDFSDFRFRALFILYWNSLFSVFSTQYYTTP